MMAGRERRDLRCQMHRRRRWARNSGEKALVFSPARLSRNRPAGRKKGREHEVGSGAGQAAAESGRPEPRGGWGCSRRRRLPLPSRFHRPRAPGAPPAARASWGTPGPRASARRAAVDRALPARCGVEWRRASDRIRLGRPGARRGGAGRSQWDVTPALTGSVPSPGPTAPARRPRAVTGRAGSWNGNASAARSGRSREKSVSA